ncbi:hypothetical protein N7470_004952 [Penicillium chermesinum]|nr:hypothetical protein N7470_004952 [Penicillium chermesinum]
MPDGSFQYGHTVHILNPDILLKEHRSKLHLRQVDPNSESREGYKRRIYRGIKIGLSFWAILVLFEVIKTGAYQEDLRAPMADTGGNGSGRIGTACHPEYIGKIMTNWPMVGAYLNQLIEELEDTEGEGKGIVDQEEGGDSG